MAARWGSQPGAAAAAGASLPGWAQRALGALRLTEPTAIAAVVRWAEAQPEPERDLAQVAATAASRRVNDPAALLVSVIRSGTASEWLAEARRSTPPATEPRRPTAAWDCELEQLIFDLVAGLPHDRELAERRATRRFGSVHAAREAWCVFVESVPLEARVPARLEGGVAAWRRLVADYRSRQAAAEEAPAAPVHQLAPSAAPRREVACG